LGCCEGITVYNFTVDGNHDYFVIAQEYEFEQTCILVHNADPLDYKNIPVYRGGNSLELDNIKHVRVKDGLVQPTHGLSLSLNPHKLSKFGGGFRIVHIPDELQIIHRGIDRYHYEIVPKIPMTVEKYKELLKQVVLE
jgi:hypothetical protein